MEYPMMNAVSGILRRFLLPSLLWGAFVAVSPAGAADATDQDMVTQEVVLWTFADKEHWVVHWPESSGPVRHTVRLGKDSSALVVQPSDKERILSFYSGRMKSNPRIEGMAELRLEVELVSGEGVRINPFLMDAHDEGLMYKSQTLRKGRAVYTWNVAKDIVHSWGPRTNRKPDGDLRLWSLNLTVPANSAAEVRFHEAKALQRRHRMDYVNAAVETGHPLFLVIPGQDYKPKLVLKNTRNAPVGFKVRLEVERYDGEKRNAEVPVELKAGGDAALPIPDDLKEFGIRWVRYQLEDENGYVVKGKSSYACLKPAGPTVGKAKGFLFSMCQHSNRYPDDIRELEIRAAALCGVKVIREFSSWGQLNPKKDVWRWQSADEIVALAEKYHVELQASLGLCAQWDAPEKGLSEGGWQFLFYPPKNLENYAEFAGRCAERYKGKIRFWEIWNEPDLSHFWRGTTDQYIEMLRLSYQAIKKADPDALVLNGGFACLGTDHPGTKLNPDMHDRVLRDGQQWFDIYAVHQHGLFDVFHRNIQQHLGRYRGLMKTDKPLYFNETAMHCVGLSEQTQAETLFKKLLYAWSIGAMGYTWYDLRNDGEQPRNPEHNYGMLTQDFHPKAVYCMYNTLAGLLSDKTYVAPVPASEGAFVYLFKGEGAHVAAGWVENPTVPDQMLTFAVGKNAQAVSVDPMGNETPVAVSGGVVCHKFGAGPSFLVVRNSDRCEPIQGIVELPKQLTARPGEIMELPLTLNNPFDRPVDVKLRLGLPAALKRTDNQAGEFTVPVPAGGSKTLAIRLLPGQRPNDAALDKPVPITLEYDVGNGLPRGQLIVPVQWILVVDAKSLENPSPLFWLHTQQQVVSIGAHDPSVSHLAWKGPEDLSARIWLGKAGNAVVLKVVVEDDVQQQPYTGAETWKGDSVQFGLQVPRQEGYWELGLARDKDGKPVVHTAIRPKALADPSESVDLQVARAGTQTTYVAKLPYAAFGISDESLAKKGVKFNLIVNDSDENAREGWIQLGPGIGEAKNPEKFIEIFFRE